MMKTLQVRKTNQVFVTNKIFLNYSTFNFEFFIVAGLLNSPSKTKIQDSQIDTGILDWDAPVKTETVEGNDDLFLIIFKK